MSLQVCFDLILGFVIKMNVFSGNFLPSLGLSMYSGDTFNPKAHKNIQNIIIVGEDVLNGCCKILQVMVNT